MVTTPTKHSHNLDENTRWKHVVAYISLLQSTYMFIFHHFPSKLCETGEFSKIQIQWEIFQDHHFWEVNWPIFSEISQKGKSPVAPRRLVLGADHLRSLCAWPWCLEEPQPMGGINGRKRFIGGTYLFRPIFSGLKFREYP